MPEFRLVIPGEPVAKARPKLGVLNGHARAFTPKRTRTYDDIVRNVAAQQWHGQKMLADVAITMAVHVYRGVPQSWPKKRQAAARAGIVRPIGKPDWDNFGKAISDGLNGVVYLDDALIVDAHVVKWYADEPRVEILLSWPDTASQAAPAPRELELTAPIPARSPPPEPDLSVKPF